MNSPSQSAINGSSNMKNLHRKRLLRNRARWCAAGLAALSLGLSGCGNRDRESSFRNEEFCISFPRPPTWAVADEQTLPTIVTFRDTRGPGRVVLTIREDRDLIFAPPRRYLETFGERQKDDDPSFRLSIESETNVNGIAGIRFLATTEDEKGSGFYFIRNNAEYCILGMVPRFQQEPDEMFETVLQGLSVCELPDNPTPWEYPLKPVTDFNAALRYGRELVKTRDVNVSNYQMAIEQFRGVLRGTYRMDPQPPEYHVALRMLEVAKTFQHQAFIEYRFRAEQYLGLRNRGEAIQTADYLLDLIPDRNDPRHRVAMSLYQKAIKLPAGN